jgi:hypothetical protein
MIRIIITIIFLLPSLCIAAPSVSGVSGTVADGESVTISGSSFGSHALNIEWIGDDIESTTTGNSPTVSGWIFTTNVNQVVATDQYHSGSKSLKAFIPGTAGGGDTSGSIRYDSGASITAGDTYYVTWWVRYNVGIDGSGYQWKMFRVNYQNDISDDAPQWVMFNWDYENQFSMRYGPTSGDGNNMYPSYPTSYNTWYRMEAVINTAAEGSTSGSWTIIRHLPSTGISSSSDSGLTYASGVTDRHRWFLWQNYIGNSGGNLTVWTDDNYVQVGTQARVELGDASTWDACTFRDVQVPTAWSSSSITITVNQGAFADSETAYVYVVDADGNPSSIGREVTIGAGESPPDSAYTGLVYQ